MKGTYVSTKGKSIIPTLPMAALLAMQVEDLLGYGKAAVDTDEKAKSASANHKATFPMLGKVISALKKHFNKEAEGNTLFSQMTFYEFFKMKTGGKVNTHAESCGKAFGAFVDNKLIAETDYDACPAAWLEKAASIVTEVQADMTREEVMAAADVLKTRNTNTGAKELDSIIEGLKGPKTIEEGKARDMIAKIFKSGHISVVIGMLGAEVRCLTEGGHDLQEYFDGLRLAVDSCGTEAQQEEWTSATSRPAQPATVTEATFTDWALKAYEGITPGDAAEAAGDVKLFYAEHKRLPKGAAEMDKWLEAAAKAA